MLDSLKKKLGWLPLFVLIILVFGMPVVAIWIHYEVFWGLVAFVWPIILFMDRVGFLQVLSVAIWLYFAFAASIVVWGYGTILVGVGWVILILILIDGFRFLNS